MADVVSVLEDKDDRLYEGDRAVEKYLQFTVGLISLKATLVVAFE